MRLYVMTDLEGVAGVLNSEDWCGFSSRYYEAGRTLLTAEVNAAIDGFFAGGAEDVLVVDGHGSGAIDPLRLDARAGLFRGALKGYPCLRDGGFDAIAWIGQHARARAPFAHLAHTGSYAKLEYTINGMPVGEFGQLALVAHELGIRPVLGTGDEAFCAEATALVPGMVTVAVKRGTTPGTGDECDAEAYSRRNESAFHRAPVRAREMIRAGAEQAMQRARSEPPGPVHAPEPPYEMVMRFRPQGKLPATVALRSHPDSVLALLEESVLRKAISFNENPAALRAAYQQAPVAWEGIG